jgi:hypothetical protein
LAHVPERAGVEKIGKIDCCRKRKGGLLWMEGVIATMQAVSILDGVNIKVIAFFIIELLLLGWRLLHFGQLVGAHTIIVFNLK